GADRRPHAEREVYGPRPSRVCTPLTDFPCPDPRSRVVWQQDHSHLAPDAVAMDVTREEVLLAIDHAVEQLLEQAGGAAPPVDAIVLAQRHLGMTVCLDEREQQRARAQRAGQRKQIFLRPEPSEERHQWTVAHEIGEHLKPGLLHRLGLDTDRTSTLLGE